jgi:protein TonB
VRQIHIRHKRRKKKGGMMPFIIGSVLLHLLLLISLVISQFDVAPKVAKQEKKQPEFIEITDIPVPKEKETKPPKETKRLAERSHDAPEEKTRDEYTKRGSPPVPPAPQQPPAPPVPPQPEQKPRTEVKKQQPKPAEKKAEKKTETKVAKREEIRKQVQKEEAMRKEALAALPREELNETGKQEAQEQTPTKDLSKITRDDLFSGVPSSFSQPSNSSPDYLGARDINKKEDTVELSTTEYKYFSYFAKLKRQIEGVWGYPQESRMRGEQGQLYLVFTIKRNGELANIELLRSSGYARLDEEAMRAIRTAAPYAPFPEAWGALETLNIKATFIYEFGGFIR